jgi:hypothetical protein
VWEALKNNPNRTPNDEKKIEFHLQHTADAKLVYVARSYHFQNAPPWLEQALREHAAKPFRAIISSTKVEGASHVLPVDEFDKELLPLWQVSPSCQIERTPEAIAGLVKLLCAKSSVVKLLDPHFRSDHARFKKTFRKLFETIGQVADSKVKIEVHCECKKSQELCTDKEQSSQDFEARLRNEWPELIPPGRKIFFYQWAEAPLGEQMHRRLILSERGGILVEAGLDAGNEGQTTTATILSTAEHLRFWKGLAVPTGGGPSPDALFELKDFCDVSGVAKSSGYENASRWR